MVNQRGTTTEAITAVLELTASGRPELLEFQLETFLNSEVRFALRQLAAAFDVPLEQLGVTIYRACLDLDALEKRRGAWRDPRQVIASPNVAALFHLCAARAGRIQGAARRRRLDGMLYKLEQAHELARSRAWIENFIGQPQPLAR